MNRTMLIVVGVLVVAGLIAYVVGSASNAEEAGRFKNYTSCTQLVTLFAALPVSDSAADRRQIGDEYRARFSQLGC